MDRQKIQKIRRVVWAHYKKQGRHDLPWRNTTNPYRILVSEIMLQQTQVARVIPKYRTFLKSFPTMSALAKVPLRDVLVAWQGLGYNRRAKMLHEAAKKVAAEHRGRMPHSLEELVQLPGVGPYTAGAVCAFAYDQAVPLVETNIRTVLFYHHLANRTNVSDAELYQLSEQLMDTKKPREWYWALMDYGAWLKEQGVRTNVQSKHYTKQSKFKGSDREVRGAILRVLTEKENLTTTSIIAKTKTAPARVLAQLLRLKKEGMIRHQNDTWRL